MKSTTLKISFINLKILFNRMKDEKNLVVGFIGEDEDAGDVLFKGFKEFHPKRVVLLIKKSNLNKEKEIKEDLKKFSIDCDVVKVGDNLHMEEVFLEIQKITQKYRGYNIVINVDTDYYTSCLALSAAFVNGIIAIGMLKEEIIVYPIMKFSYYNALNDKKFELLRLIDKEGRISSMEKLAKLSKMSLPLIAYHLRGNRDSKGLVEMNLVDTKRTKTSVEISLTTLGKLIVKGSVSCPVR